MSKSRLKALGFQITEQIGNEAIGAIYKGINTKDGSNVAIKEIPLKDLDEQSKAIINQEISILKNLKHENIIKYIDTISTETHANILFEYANSGSLSSIITKFGPFPETLAAIYFKQVLTALDYLHSQGIVHRDMKGANILLTKDGLIKLKGFGLAVKLTEGEKTVVETDIPYWIAPEIIESRDNDISTACDIWSVGCTVVELLVGSPPYYDLPGAFARERILWDDQMPLPSGISENCKDFLEKCFVKEPVLRVDGKSLLKHPWIVGALENSNSKEGGRINCNEENSLEIVRREKEDLKIIDELNESIKSLESIQDFPDSAKMEETIKNGIRIIEILRKIPSMKEYFMKKFGLIKLVDILEQK